MFVSVILNFIFLISKYLGVLHIFINLFDVAETSQFQGTVTTTQSLDSHINDKYPQVEMSNQTVSVYAQFLIYKLYFHAATAAPIVV